MVFNRNKKNDRQDVWTFSKTGMRHVRDNLENQDVIYRNENDRIRFVAVSDGVSTCANGRKGAEIACEAAFRAFDLEAEYLFSLKEKSIAYLIVKYIQSEIKSFAVNSGESVLSFASTLSFICIDKQTDQAVVFSLGDSAIGVLTDKKKFLPLGGAPDFSSNVCCAVTTKKAYLDADIVFLRVSRTSSVFIGTDGAWKTMLNNGKLNDKVGNYLLENDTEKLERYFNEAQSMDDCSCALINLAA